MPHGTGMVHTRARAHTHTHTHTGPLQQLVGWKDIQPVKVPIGDPA